MKKNGKEIKKIEYSESNFWDKVKNFSKSAGKEVIGKALQLYYVLQEDNVPLKIKTTIYGALAYFISPIDVIPDVVPIFGFADDLGIIVASLAAVSLYVTDNVKKKANDKLKEWF